MTYSNVLANPFDPASHPFCHSGHQYALDVVGGKIPNCKWVIGACERYLREVSGPTDKFYFNSEAAEKYLRLVQKFEHVIGEWPTPTIVYSPWQNWVWMNIMGFISRETGFRRFRTAHVEVPRGNAKSAMASQSALYFLSLDNPKGNHIATVATRKEQARIVLDSARAMAKKSKSYIRNTGTKVLAHSIVHPDSESKVRALASDSTGLDGLNEILAILDELHAMRRTTFDVVESGMSKRKDSLMLCITTAGFDVEGVGHSQSTYAKKVCSGEVQDDQFFAVVYTIDEGDDIFEEETWKKANPGYGVSVDPVNFASKAKKAFETPADLPNFKVKHLNIWLSEARQFYDLSKWDACADPTLRIEDFAGQPCVDALDVASKIDLASIASVFRKNGIYYIFDKSYIPEERAREVRSSMYDNCIGSGHLIATPGEAIQYEVLKKEIVDQSKKFKMIECAYDPWNALEIAQSLTAEKVEMVEFRMNTANLSEPTKQFDALIRQGKVRHNGSPLLRWCLGNVVCKEDAAGNVFPRKSHEKLKIDPIIAILMALAVWIQKDPKESVYSNRGLRIL